MGLLVRLMVMTSFSFLFISTPDALAIKKKFVGVAQCKKCHAKIVASWASKKHAAVFKLLKANARGENKTKFGLNPATDYRTDTSCLNCHASGINQGGYNPAQPDPKWEGIQCEVCHGGAEEWLDIHDRTVVKNKKRRLKQTGMKKPLKGKTVCIRCHGNMNSPFKERDHNFDRDWTLKKWNETYHITPEPDPKPEMRP